MRRGPFLGGMDPVCPLPSPGFIPSLQCGIQRIYRLILSADLFLGARLVCCIASIQFSICMFVIVRKLYIAMSCQLLCATDQFTRTLESYLLTKRYLPYTCLSLIAKMVLQHLALVYVYAAPHISGRNLPWALASTAPCATQNCSA